MKRGIWGRMLVSVAALCFVAAAATAASKGKNSIEGNWDLDVAKSSLNGASAYKSGHVSVTVLKGAYKGVVDIVPATGAPVHYEYSFAEDGANVPVTGNTYFDSATVLRVDKNTTIRTERRGGKVVGVTTIEVAKDGKTFSSSSKGTLPDGKQFARTLSWNRAKKK
jgi:hypothetical protein